MNIKLITAAVSLLCWAPTWGMEKESYERKKTDYNIKKVFVSGSGILYIVSDPTKKEGEMIDDLVIKSPTSDTFICSGNEKKKVNIFNLQEMIVNSYGQVFADMGADLPKEAEDAKRILHIVGNGNAYIMMNNAGNKYINTVNIGLTGYAKYDAKNLCTSHINVDLSGHSKAYINPYQSVKGKTTSCGAVHCYTPEVRRATLNIELDGTQNIKFLHY
jgi:hypothetical protein